MPVQIAKDTPVKTETLSIKDLSFGDRRVLIKLAPALFLNNEDRRIGLPDALMVAGAGPDELRSLDRLGISESGILEAGQMFRLIIMSGARIPRNERENMISATEEINPIAAYFALLAFNLRDRMEAGDKMAVLDEFLNNPYTVSDEWPVRPRT